MSKVTSKISNRLRRQNRIRTTVTGTAERPRLSVFVSNRNVSAQLIDDSINKTLLSSTSSHQKELDKSNLTDKAVYVGQDIAKKAKAKKITKVVLDRNGKLYHGRVKALAETARESGMEF